MGIPVKKVPFIKIDNDGMLRKWNVDKIHRYRVLDKGTLTVTAPRYVRKRIYYRNTSGYRETERKFEINRGDIIEWDKEKNEWFKLVYVRR